MHSEPTPAQLFGRSINVYPAQSGGWMYEVWISERPVVVGWCTTREAAEQEAALA